MALPNKSIQQIQDLLGNNVDVAPTMMTDSNKNYKAELSSLHEDSKIELEPISIVIGVDATYSEEVGSLKLYNNISERFRLAVLGRRNLNIVMNGEVVARFNFGSITNMGDYQSVYIYGTQLVPSMFAITEEVNNIAYVNTGSASTDILIWATRDIGQVTDVRINGVSIIQGDTLADIETEGTYDSSTNKIATMNDIQYPVVDVYVDGSSVVDSTTKIAHITLPSGALKFLGTTTTTISDGSTTNPITINGQSVTATNGCVVLYSNKEFLWNATVSTPCWEELGDESSFALKTTTVTGTGALGGGGALNSNQTITHNEILGSAKTTAGIYNIKIDKYGHITEATIDNTVVHTSNTSGLIKNDGTIDTTQYLSSIPNDVVRTSNTTGLIKNDGSIDTTQYLSSIPSDVVRTSNTAGLIKNDGTIDTNTYLTTTTASNTYVPISSGTDLGTITNNSSYIKLLYGDGVDRFSNIILTDDAIGLYIYTLSGETDVALDDSGITIIADDIKWNNKTLATTDQIPDAVVANPTLAGTETNLTGLQIGSTKYKLENGTVTSIDLAGTGLTGSTNPITTSGTITLDSSADGNANANKVVLRNANGSIQSEKIAISSGTTTKATMQYNLTDDCIDFIFS